MGNMKRLPQRLQALALISVCTVRLVAPELAFAQAAPPTTPTPAVPPAPAAPPPSAAPVQAVPGTAPAAPAPDAAEQPALPTYPPSATPPEQAVGPDGQPVTPAAAEPTSPPAYVEPITPIAPEGNIQAAPTIDEQLVTEPSSKLPSYLMWGIGGASLITGAVLGVTALTAKSDFNDNPTYAAADKIEGRAIAADVALGLGVVLLVTGTAFYFLPESQEPRPATASNTKRPTARLSVAPMLGRTNGGSLTLQF